MHNIEVRCEEISAPQWLPAVSPFLLTVLERLSYSNWDISILFCNDRFIHELNKTYRGIDSATDVLSFEQGDSYHDAAGDLRFNAGDIVISLDSLKSNAEFFKVPVDEELRRLLIHGVLHLSGMDHANNDPQQEMLILQETILEQCAGTIIRQE
ncbi:MAG: rRNA maturation RNase YbeY [Treponema sp.]